MELRTRLEEAPRIPLGVWPTPFMPMDGLRVRLSAQGIECPRLWIKREDMTPLGAGGNKIRKLEHVLAKARAEGADVLLNTGEVQSNQVVQTAASGAPRTAGSRPGRGHATPGREAKGRRAASLHHPPRLLHGGRGARFPALLFRAARPGASQRLHAERHCRHRGQFGHHGGVPRRCARPCPFGRAGHPPLRLRHLRHGLPGAGP